ncbi:hypothetical protein FraQA3DRAFT_0186 [Frankia sp. QA3]|nr:hypothetical protein FraQA3DRAFT_0186 [Frankia sp. QA3]
MPAAGWDSDRPATDTAAGWNSVDRFRWALRRLLDGYAHA